MVERVLVALAVVGLVVLAVAAGRTWLRLRDGRILARLRAEAGDPPLTTTRPRLVYFTTTTCVVCRVQQEPAIEALRARLPDLLVERHDAVAERTLAAEYGVLSVPTIAVYDRRGELVTVNRGFTPAAVLRSQLEGTELLLEGGAAMASETVE